MILLKVLRVKEWWGYKVPMLLGVFIFFSGAGSPGAAFHLLGASCILLLWTFATAAFGYLINNVFDIEQDLSSGRSNFAASLRILDKALLAMALASLSLLIWLLFFPSGFLLLLTVIELSLFALYSIPPIRLKERGYLGVLTDAFYAFCLPVMVSFYFASAGSGHPVSFSDGPAIILVIWSLAGGARSILLHHFKDRKDDRISGTNNVVNAYGIRTNSLLINLVLLPVEVVCFYIVLSQHPLFPLARIIIFTLYLFIITFSVSRYGLVWNFRRRFVSMRFSPTQFYEGWFLLVNLIILAIFQPVFWLAIPLQVVLFQNEVFEALSRILTRIAVQGYIWAKAFYYALKRLIKPVVVNSWHHLLRPVISFLVNYSIYIFRRLILWQSNEKAKTPIAGWKGRDTSSVTQQAQEEMAKKTERKRVIRKASEVWRPDGELSEDNRIVNGLWIGSALSNIELLSIKSFLAAGHTFRLWVYGPVQNIPSGVEVCDANSIIPAAQIFRYKYTNAFGHGKGSVSGFSDVFRYKLLYDEGGWWVDMDICCIRPFNFDTPYFFRSHHDLDMVGNIMKSPRGSQLMWDCYVEAKETIDENNTDWHKPIEILNRHIMSLGLSAYVFKDFSNEDKWGEIRRHIYRDTALHHEYVALHWMNEEWRSRGINKNDIRYNSTLGKLLVKYDIIQRPLSKYQILSNDFRHLFWAPIYDRWRNQ